MELNAKNMKKIMLLIVFAVVLFWGFQNYAVLLKAAAYLAGIARPFVIGLCIAFILNVLLHLLENGWERVWRKRNRGAVKRLQRPVCLLLSIGVITGAVLVLMLMIVPEIVKTVTKVIEAVPAYIDELEPKYKELVERLKLPFGSLPSLEIDREKIMAVVVDYLKKGGPSLFSKTAGFTASVFSGLFTFILAFVFSIYILLQKETLAAQVKKLMAAYVPEKKGRRGIACFPAGQLDFFKVCDGPADGSASFRPALLRRHENPENAVRRDDLRAHRRDRPDPLFRRVYRHRGRRLPHSDGKPGQGFMVRRIYYYSSAD